MDKVLLGEMSILIRFNVKALTQVNSLQIQMYFNTLPISSRIKCLTWINSNLDVVDKRWRLLLCKFYLIRVNVNVMRIHSRVSRAYVFLSSLSV